jgi:hypothetical protein
MDTPRITTKSNQGIRQPNGSHLSSGQDQTYSPRYRAYWNTTPDRQIRMGTPLLQAGEHTRCPRGSREKFSCRVHQVLGLPVPFPTSVRSKA